MTAPWPRSLPLLAGLLAATPLLIAPVVLRGDRATDDHRPPSASSSPRQSAVTLHPIDSALPRAIRTAPFRPDRRPSAVAYDPSRLEQASLGAMPPKPNLALAGLLGGREPVALVEGIPGRDGPVLLAVGDTAGGLKVRRIKGGEVTVSGMDTTWMLTVQRAQ